MFYEKNFRENIINPFWTQLVNRAQACIREGFHPNYPDLNLRVIYFPSTWSTFHFRIQTTLQSKVCTGIKCSRHKQNFLQFDDCFIKKSKIYIYCFQSVVVVVML